MGIIAIVGIMIVKKTSLMSALADGLKRSRTRLEPNKQRINQIPNSFSLYLENQPLNDYLGRLIVVGKDESGL